jgi:aminoglycoside 3-N-acetyltransferase I
MSMTDPAAIGVRRLGPGDVEAMRALLGCFGEAFDDPGSYLAAQPDSDYLAGLLGSSDLVVSAALVDGAVVGGLTAYELRKHEQARSEFCIYDLAVLPAHRRRGIATALIRALKPIARRRGAWVIYVQADLGDEPAIALYSGLGVREDVLHFDIPVE